MILTIGVCCFGALIGYITHRTLVRTKEASVGDLSTVVGAVGGGAVTAIVDPGTDLFGVYAIALLVGYVFYGGLYVWLNGWDDFAKVMAKSDRGSQENDLNPGPAAPRGR